MNYVIHYFPAGAMRMPLKIKNSSSLHKDIISLCETIKSKVGNIDFQDFVFPLLFLRYLSDASKYITTSTIKTEKFNIYSKINLSEESDFYSLLSSKFDSDIGRKINFAFYFLEKYNSEELEGISSSFDYSSKKFGVGEVRNNLLRTVLDFIDGLEWANASLEDKKNQIWSVLDSLIAMNPYSGESFTPVGVANLAAELLSPVEKDAIFDPACGSGAMLVSCAKFLNEAASLAGQERNASAWAIAKMSLLIAGHSPKEIILGDGVRTPYFTDENRGLRKFDIVLCNPSFGARDWGLDASKLDPFDRFKFGTPSKTSGEYGFLLHTVASMKPETGRALIIVTNGALSRSGSEYKIRANLIDYGLISAIIRLPGKLFANTSIPVNFLILKEEKSQSGIFFVDASEEYIADRNRNRLTHEAIENISACFKGAKEIDGFSRFVGLEEVRKNDYNLTVQRYITKQQKVKKVDLDFLRQRESEILHRLNDIDIAIQGVISGDPD